MRLSSSAGIVITLLRCARTALAVSISDFDWASIEPSESLTYVPCYETHKCAKLLLPLDWLDPVGNNATVAVAIMARPATVDESDESFGGTIVMNPGGPGGWGIGALLVAGGLLQGIADGDNKKYEILSFDPRGVGFTTPAADCYENEYSRSNAGIVELTIGLQDDRDLARRMARAKAFGQLCSNGMSSTEDSNDIRNFMSTASVARDMLEIITKIDELRGHANDHEGDVDGENARLELRSEKKQQKQTQKQSAPRIQFWGLSYGTDLGNYFASMFPGNVGRMILEAVQDPVEYASGLWPKSGGDIQNVYSHFWDTCFRSGSRCALYRASDTSSDDIRSRFEYFLSALAQSPAPYTTGSNIVAITDQDVMIVIFAALYSPLQTFPILAITLNEAMAGNWGMLYSQLPQAQPDSCPALIPSTYTWKADAAVAVLCGDGEDRRNMTLSDYKNHIKGIQEDSPDFWPFLADISLPCTGWPFRPKYRFQGPWTTPEPDSRRVKGHPEAPILFISSLYDPVTSLSQARKASKGHPGSGILVQDNAGHGTLTTPGKCRDAYIKKYLETGEVPGEGMEVHCAPDCIPFQDCSAAIGVEMLDESSIAWLGRGPIF